MSSTPQNDQVEQIRAIVVAHAKAVADAHKRIEAKLLAQHDVIRGIFATSAAADAGLRGAFERIAAEREQRAEGREVAEVTAFYLEELRALIRYIEDGPNLTLIKGGLSDDER